LADLRVHEDRPKESKIGGERASRDGGSRSGHGGKSIASGVAGFARGLRVAGRKRKQGEEIGSNERTWGDRPEGGDAERRVRGR
jgi:hypothetical protein